MRDFYSLVGVTRPFDPSHRFATSIILPTSLFAALRLLLSLYAFTTIFVIFGWDCTYGRRIEARQWFSYFTNLTYFGLAFYFLFAGLHSLTYAIKGQSWLNKWSRPLQAAHSVFYTTIVVFPPLVTIVYWSILYKHWFTVTKDAWSNISQHALNSLYALVEIILARTDPPPPLHLAFLIIILALYVGLAYLCHRTEGIYVYSFLDPTKGSGRVAGYVFGILAAVIVIFAVVYGLIWLRGFVARKLGLDADKTKRPPRQQEHEMGFFEEAKV